MGKKVIDFILRFWKVLALLVAVIAVSGAEWLGLYESIEMSKYIPSFTGALTITVLLWLWKLDYDMKEKFDQQTKDLKSEIDENEVLLSQLFLAFRKQLGDAKFESLLREIILHYPSLKSKDRSHIIANLALTDLKKISNNLQRQQYEAPVFGVIDHYPKPFYKGVYSSIIATDIVTENDEFWPRQNWEKMIKLNEEAVVKVKGNSFETGIRRIFIIKNGVSKARANDTQDLMQKLHSVGVVVKQIDWDVAHQRIMDERRIRLWQEVKGVEDFSVFDASQGNIKYAGRFKDPETKIVVISTEQTTIAELEQQFEILWDISTAYVEPTKKEV